MKNKWFNTGDTIYFFSMEPEVCINSDALSDAGTSQEECLQEAMEMAEARPNFFDRVHIFKVQLVHVGTVPLAPDPRSRKASQPPV